jgi:predicted nucleic acid-binding protein
MVLIDSNILLDVWQNDPLWSPRSIVATQQLALSNELTINAVVFAEISVRFPSHTDVEQALASLAVTMLTIPNEAAFVAAKAFERYRKQGGTKTNVLPDFFIGAHAAVLGCPLLTRDTGRYATYFPTISLIAP